MNIEEAKQSFLNLIQCWPLHKATLFDVNVSFNKIYNDHCHHYHYDQYHLMIFISAILHIKLAQEPVAGRGPERCSPAGGEE